MDEKELFLIRYSQIEKGLRGQTNEDFLNLSLSLRQILSDGDRLIISANRKPKLEINFEVGLSSDEREKEMIEHGLPTPDLDFLAVFPPNETKRNIKLDEFLKFNIVNYKGTHFSVIQLIKACANKFGGTHLSNKLEKSEELKIKELGNILKSMDIVGGPFSTLILIGQTTQKALFPLVEILKKT
ncbi:MAG TPA: hypothetical protein VK145_01630 [Candidatus Nanoarchaeia archaeon]|nr:hypothetical protein [Candidatus Nanoarchaeia archaeon]